MSRSTLGTTGLALHSSILRCKFHVRYLQGRVLQPDHNNISSSSLLPSSNNNRTSFLGRCGGVPRTKHTVFHLFLVSSTLGTHLSALLNATTSSPSMDLNLPHCRGGLSYPCRHSSTCRISSQLCYYFVRTTCTYIISIISQQTHLHNSLLRRNVRVSMSGTSRLLAPIPQTLRQTLSSQLRGHLLQRRSYFLLNARIQPLPISGLLPYRTYS